MDEFNEPENQNDLTPSTPDLDTGLPKSNGDPRPEVEQLASHAVPPPYAAPPREVGPSVADQATHDPAVGQSLTEDTAPVETDAEFRVRVNKALARIETKLGKCFKQLGIR